MWNISNPIEVLRDNKIADLFIRMLAHRYRTDILSDYYRLPNIPSYFTYFSRRISPYDKAQREVEFILNRIDEDLDQICEAFWSEMLPHGNHLADHISVEDKYNEIALYASDLKLIKPLFYIHPEHQYLDIADIGAGRNKLGKAILDYFHNVQDKASYLNWIANLQNAQYGSKNVTVIGTDVHDGRESDNSDNKYKTQLDYRLQPTPSQIPIEDNSRDVVVTKWCLHHMTRCQMERQINNIYRILRPAGIAIIIEGFLTAHDAPINNDGGVPHLSYKQMLTEVSRRFEFADIWPEGPWKQDCFSISSDYLDLSCEEQAKVLALEDFFGHYVLNRRESMRPFPCSYMPAENLIEKFVEAGFIEQPWNFTLFGSAPVIRRGPFSARFIFEKPEPR